jgi:hypothetical protein
MAASKPRASDDGILMLIQYRRNNALAAMREIVAGFRAFPVKVPKMSLLVAYLSDMAFCLELMLKFLSGNWDDHNVRKMYAAIFETEYTKSDFLVRLEQTIKSQKYLIEPATGIAEYIPEIEALYDALRGKVRTKQDRFSVQSEYELPASVGEFLRDHVARFYTGETIRVPPGANLKAISDHQMAAWEEDVKNIAANLDHILKLKGSLQVFEGTVHIT